MKKALTILLIALLAFTVSCSKDEAATAESQGPVTLKVLSDQGPVFNINDEPLKGVIEDATGYKLDIEKQPVDPNQRENKLNLIFASNLDYDVVRLPSMDYAKRMIPNGYFTELDDLLEKYGQNILKNTKPEHWEPCVYNGKTYAIPVQRTSAGCVIGTIYRKDVFDRLGLEVPGTPEELREVLRVLKKDNGGKAPYVLSATYPIQESISSAFGINQNDWYVLDGKIVNRVHMPGFKAYLEYMKSLFDEGLIDQEWAANNDQMTQTKMASGQAAMSTWAWWFWPSNNAVRSNPGAEIGFLPALHGEDGTCQSWMWGFLPEWATVIPVASEKAVDAVKFLNDLADPETFKKIYLGEEGVDYQLSADGTYEALPPYSEERACAWGIMLTSCAPLQMTFQQVNQSGEDPAKDVMNTFLGLVNAAKDSATADPTSLLAPPRQQNMLGSLKSLEGEFVLNCISGVKSIDELDDFLKNWEAQGGAELEAAWNEIYQASLSK